MITLNHADYCAPFRDTLGYTCRDSKERLLRWLDNDLDDDTTVRRVLDIARNAYVYPFLTLVYLAPAKAHIAIAGMIGTVLYFGHVEAGNTVELPAKLGNDSTWQGTWFQDHNGKRGIWRSPTTALRQGKPSLSIHQIIVGRY